MAHVEAEHILVPLYEGENILIDPTTGDETIANAGDVFTGYFDPDFEHWGTNKPSGVATDATPAKVYEMHRNATFADMFASLGDIDDLCWQQGQIINFCRKHPDKLRQDGFGTFLPFKVEGVSSPFVSRVRVLGGGLGVDVGRLGLGIVWGAGYRGRVVVPQLDA